MSFLKEYTLLGELGKGGFAKVYKVRHNELGYIRAIRVLNEPITDERSRTYQKFLHECKVLLRLGNGNHRNIVHIYQPRLLENHALVEMDYVDGQDITHYLKDNGNFLPIEEVMRMVEEMSNALAYCHEDIYQFCMDPDEDDLQNDPIDGSKWLIDDATKKRLIEKYKVIHNDIHSGNIMRRRDGSFVLLDFGLAIEGDEVVKSSSRHENGAPEYMPPEKWDNDTILTEQSDIYSFGVVMYEYLAGRVPFVCEGNSFNARKKLYEKIKNSIGLPSIGDLRKSFFEEKHKGETYKKDYPEWIEKAILKCLEKDPAKRFRNGKELHDYITKHLQNEAITKESVQNLVDENTVLKGEKQQALMQVSDLTKKNMDLAALASSMQYELDKARKDLENANTQSDEKLARELKYLQEKIKQKDTDITSLQSDVMELERQLKESKNNSELQKKIEYLNNQIDNLEKQVTQTQQEKKAFEDEIAKLKAEGTKSKPLPIVLCVLFGIVAAVLGFLYANKGGNAIPPDYNSIKTENAELKETNAGLENEITNLNNTISDLRNAKPGQSSREKELEMQFEQANNTISSLETQINELNAEINKLKKSNQSPSAREKELERQLNQANSTIKTLRNEKTKDQAALNTAIEEVKNLGSKVSALKKKLKDCGCNENE